MTPSDNPKTALFRKWRDCLSEIARGAKTGSGGAMTIASAACAVGILGAAAGLAGYDASDVPAVPLHKAVTDIGAAFLIGAGAAYAVGYGFKRAAQVLVKKTPVRTRPHLQKIGTIVPFVAALALGAGALELFASNVVIPKTLTVYADTSCPDSLKKVIREAEQKEKGRLDGMVIRCTRPVITPVKDLNFAVPAYDSGGS